MKKAIFLLLCGFLLGGLLPLFSQQGKGTNRDNLSLTALALMQVANEAGMDAYNLGIQFGLNAIEEDKYSEAILYFTAVLELKQNDTDALILRATAYFFNAEFEKAKADIALVDTRNLNNEQRNMVTSLKNILDN